MRLRLSDRELATVLAALRYWRQDLADNAEHGEGPISEEHFDDKVTPLTVEELRRPLRAPDRYSYRRKAWETAQATAGFVYYIPPGPGPRAFRKVEPTEPELIHYLFRFSPFTKVLPAMPRSTLLKPKDKAIQQYYQALQTYGEHRVTHEGA